MSDTISLRLYELKSGKRVRINELLIVYVEHHKSPSVRIEKWKKSSTQPTTRTDSVCRTPYVETRKTKIGVSTRFVPISEICSSPSLNRRVVVQMMHFEVDW